MQDIIKKHLNEWVFPESLLAEVGDEIDLSSFKVRDNLNPKIWDNNKIKPEIASKLITIAEDFYKDLDIKTPIKDIRLTGSLANYNWSVFSDVDLHIIFDPSSISNDPELITDLLNTKTREWNGKHNITIKGFPVELYLQSIKEEHHSSGIYSIMNNEWVIEPIKRKGYIDRENIRKKYKSFVKDIEELKEAGRTLSAVTRIRNLKEKIRHMRKSGLEKGGEFSVENLVFKLLRRNNNIEDLNNLLVSAYDNAMTIETEYQQLGQ